jgi:hypothetical protein
VLFFAGTDSAVVLLCMGKLRFHCAEHMLAACRHVFVHRRALYMVVRISHYR